MVPGFGVVLVNWNNAADTISALDSLWNAVPRPIEVAVVDSGSVDDSVAKINAWSNEQPVPVSPGNSAWMTLFQLEENRGFAGGNNIGMKHLLNRSEVTHILLLNNDAMVAPTFFGELARALAVVPTAGLMTGTIFEHPDRNKVWYAGGREIPYRALIEHKMVVPVSDEPVETEFISGCAMLISRPVIEKIGLLPEIYFPLYSEDAEYSHRARAAGFPVLYAPRAIVYHKVGATVGPASTSPYIMRAQVRHRVMYVRRNFRGWNRFVALGYLLVTKPGKALVETFSGRAQMGWAVFVGTLDGFLRKTEL